MHLKKSEVKKIWLVNTWDNREQLRLKLQNAGYEIISMQDAQQLFELLAQNVIDNLPSLIVLDVSPAHIIGIDVCRQIRTRPEFDDIPILLLSNQTDLDSKIQGFDLGGADFITKPFEVGELLARINSQLSLYFRLQKLKAENQSLVNQCQELKEQLAVAAEARKLAAQQVNALRQERIQLLNLSEQHRKPPAERKSALHRLTNREIEILKLIANGMDNKGIAAALNVTESTVRSYRSRVANKLSAQNTYELMRIAMEHFGQP